MATKDRPTGIVMGYDGGRVMPYDTTDALGLGVIRCFRPPKYRGVVEYKIGGQVFRSCCRPNCWHVVHLASGLVIDYGFPYKSQAREFARRVRDMADWSMPKDAVRMAFDHDMIARFAKVQREVRDSGKESQRKATQTAPKNPENH